MHEAVAVVIHNLCMRLWKSDDQRGLSPLSQSPGFAAETADSRPRSQSTGVAAQVASASTSASASAGVRATTPAGPPRTPRRACGSRAARPGTSPAAPWAHPERAGGQRAGAARPDAFPRRTRSGSPSSTRSCTRAVGVEPEAEVDLGLGGVGGGGLGRPVGVEQGHDPGPGGDQAAPHRGHQGVEATLLADGDPPTEQRAGGLAQAVAVADRAHELGVASAGRDPAELAERSTPPGCRRRAGRCCAGSRPGPATVSSPKMPSTRPVSKPRADRRRCSSATSSPRSIGRRR